MSSKVVGMVEDCSVAELELEGNIVVHFNGNGGLRSAFPWEKQNI